MKNWYLLQAQMEGLESIFFELYPFRVELKRQQVQDHYNQRFNSVTPAQVSVSRGELRRNFNTRANQVRNLVDSAESLGDVTNKLNLIVAAACLPNEKNRPLEPNVLAYCDGLLFQNKVDPEIYNRLLVHNTLRPSDARILLACTMFCGNLQIDKGGDFISVQELLASFITMVKGKRSSAT